MNDFPKAVIRIRVDPANPGQFFACCGLLELANRVSPGTEGWFEGTEFCIKSCPTLPELIEIIRTAPLVQLDPNDATASPIFIESPFQLRLDWWKSRDRAITDLKVWAGTMESFRIARAMQWTMRDETFTQPGLFDVGCIAYDPDEPSKKVEPYYFDARRAPNAHSRDVGFAPNDLGMTTTAFPAVELLCLIGLQRGKPLPTGRPRIFHYHLWFQPLDPVLLPAAVAGLFPQQLGYEFESCFRTGQKKHKAFQSAKLKT